MAHLQLLSAVPRTWEKNAGNASAFLQANAHTGHLDMQSTE